MGDGLPGDQPHPDPRRPVTHTKPGHGSKELIGILIAVVIAWNEFGGKRTWGDCAAVCGREHSNARDEVDRGARKTAPALRSDAGVPKRPTQAVAPDEQRASRSIGWRPSASLGSKPSMALGGCPRSWAAGASHARAADFPNEAG
jgi:hypothetical protein